MEEAVCGTGQGIQGAFKSRGAQTYRRHKIFFIRRAGDGESTSVAFQIRAIERKEGEIGELPRLAATPLRFTNPSSIKMGRGLAPPSYRTCSAHKRKSRPTCAGPSCFVGVLILLL